MVDSQKISLRGKKNKLQATTVGRRGDRGLNLGAIVKLGQKKETTDCKIVEKEKVIPI